MSEQLKVWVMAPNSALYHCLKENTMLFSFVDDPVDADCIIFENDDPAYITQTATFKQWPQKCIAVNEADVPSFYLPGCYASNRHGWLSTGRAKTIPYIISQRTIANPFIREIDEHTQQRYLYSFKGGSTSWVRKKLFKNKPVAADVCIEESNQYYHWTYDDLYMEQKKAQQQEYAALLAQSSFFLCPRGAGTGSIRLFEVIQAGRIPVIISDAWIPQSNIPWHEFSITIPEKDIAKLDNIIRAHANRAETLTANVKKAWNEYFSLENDLKLLYDAVKNIQSNRNEKREQLIRSIFPLLKWKNALKEKVRSFAKFTILKCYALLGKEFPYSLNRPISEQLAKK